MTNKRKLLMELGELSGEELFYALGPLDLANKLSDMGREDCARQHGGECPGDCEHDDSCVVSTGQWLDMPCMRETILGELMKEAEHG